MKTFKSANILPCGLALILGVMGLAGNAAGDSYWNPQGLPGTDEGKMKTMDEVEPRHLITTLPFVITAPGSYYLIRNMYGISGQPGIDVQCSDVQIDLNGFALIGTTGSFDGIRITGSNENVSIQNGSIRDWGNYGINGPDSDDGSVLNIKSHRNGMGGILYGDGALLALCTAYGNGYKAPLPPQYIEPTVADSDYDGMDDAFEQLIVDANTTDELEDVDDVMANDDFDSDGASNLMEFNANTDPTNSTDGDSDSDGMADDFEFLIINDNSTDAISNLADVLPGGDYDGDTKTNIQEFNSHTDPTQADLDSDGMDDNFEFLIINDNASDDLAAIWDVLDSDDYDLDGYSNLAEYESDTSPIDDMSIPTATNQTEYASYTEPSDSALYEEFVDPSDELSDDGIRTGGFSTIRECKARNNRGSGIYAEYGSRIVACIAAGGLTDGIHVTDYCTILDCTSVRNRTDGITIGSKCRVADNNCGQNGDYKEEDASSPRGAGIRILGSGNRVENNNLSGNAVGIKVDNSYAFQYGDTGLSGGSNLIIGNSSVDNWGKAFDLSSGDYMGGELNQGDVNDPNSTTNAVTDPNNPFSNFAF
jgi:hypothetical protein